MSEGPGNHSDEEKDDNEDDEEEQQAPVSTKRPLHVQPWLTKRGKTQDKGEIFLESMMQFMNTRSKKKSQLYGSDDAELCGKFVAATRLGPSALL